jgi:hypothetical protein
MPKPNALMPIARRRHPRGYVLVMTLLLLAVAAVALGAVATDSHGRALAAIRAQEDLQRRWGAISCTQALLPNADRLIHRPQREPGASARSASVSLRLGGQSFVVVVTDEQAKVNVNMLAARVGDPGELATLVRHLVGDGGDGAGVRLRPTREIVDGGDGKQSQRLTFAAYGQVFADAPPASLMSLRDDTAGLAADVTCWGDGRLNTAAASPAAVAALCATVLDAEELGRFRDAHSNSPPRAWADVFAELKLPAERRQVMETLTTKASSCHSLWVAADVDGRPSYRFTVASSGVGVGADVDAAAVHVFEW